ncbi:MAG: SpoIIE family protein phosphatase [Magnetococcales bacterium]|nr:SpoIIE family protein phosphatase [Magnetococcales bacterium]MBF0437562.1 SpoIIE family protein phosphatase [Magnetococcales bacterium]
MLDHISNIDLAKSTILLVDDETANLKLLRAILQFDYTLLFAKSGTVALELATEQIPDLILLDIMMPDMDGYAVCQHLKANEKTKNIPIIFITAMSDIGDEIKGFDAGGVDYLTKPVSPPIVKARVRTQISLRTAYRKLQELNEHLSFERQTIENIVSRMRNSVQFDRTHLRYLMVPAEKSSGDILLAAFRPDGTQHLVLGDFTGHGLTAAVAGPIVSDIFYSRTAAGMDMAGILGEVNRALYEKLPTDMFMVGCFLEVSAARDRLLAWNCSLPDIFVFRQGIVHQRIISGHMARGILHRPDKPGSEVALQPGDRVLFFTDGIVEEKNPNREEFDLLRLIPLLTRIATGETPLTCVDEALQQFREGLEQSDDVTLVELTC